MIFETIGEEKNPAILFFHAMGVTGASSEPVAKNLEKDFFCVMPTSTVYCPGQKYLGKEDEVKQIESFLKAHRIERLALVVASSIGADLAAEFFKRTALPVEHVFFDGGQFAKIKKSVRKIMTPLLFFAIKSLYLSNGKTLKKIMWCDDDSIKPYFISAGKALKIKILRRQLSDSLEEKPFPSFSKELQKHMFFEFGSAEDHFKYRESVMKAYPEANFPIFEGYNHMQYQIRDPKGFSKMLRSIIEKNELPTLPFLKGESSK